LRVRGAPSILWKSALPPAGNRADSAKRSIDSDQEQSEFSEYTLGNGAVWDGKVADALKVRGVFCDGFPLDDWAETTPTAAVAVSLLF